MIKNVLVVAVALVILVRGLTLWNRKHTPRIQSLNQAASAPQAPSIVLSGLDGSRITLADYRGKVVLVNFWATWCGPCEKEIPQFVELQQKYGPQGLQIVGISMDDSLEPVRSFYARQRMNYPVGLADSQTVQAFGGIFGLPVNFVLNRQGAIVAKHVGSTDFAVLQKEIEAQLITQAPTPAR
jgi:thiol-disulfide isomerase/thioredoxin